MLLYLIYDSKKSQISSPFLSPSMQIAQLSLQQLNPENLNDLIIYPLTQITCMSQLAQLRVDSSVEVPSQLLQAVASHASQSTQTECASYDN